MLDKPGTMKWWTRLDPTKGNLAKTTGILGLLFTAELAVHFGGHFVETFYMGRLGPEFISAVTLSIMVLTFGMSFFLELGTGMTTLVSQLIGANKGPDAARVIGQAILLSVGGTLPIAVAGAFLAPQFLELMGAEPSVIQVGTPYLRLGSGALLLIIMPFLLNAALRAVGNAALATGMEVFQLSLLFILTPIFVLGFGSIPRLETLGAMLALVITRLIATIIQLSFFVSGRLVVRLDQASIRTHLPTMRQLVSLSTPATLQQLARFGADAAIVRLIASYGTVTLAGFTISWLFLRLLETIGQGVGNATFTVVGQNLGAGNGHRALRGTWIATAYSWISIAVCIGLLYVLASPLITLFNSDPLVVAVGVAALRIISISFVFNAIALVLMRAFHGVGDTFSPLMVDLIVLWGIQLPLALWLSTSAGLQSNGIWVAIAVANVLRTILLTIWFRRSAVPKFTLNVS